MFRKKKSIDLNYEDQAYIFFVSRRYEKLSQAEKDKIVSLCFLCGAEHFQALFEFVTTCTPATVICLKHYISRETLRRMVKRYYEEFLKE